MIKSLKKILRTFIIFVIFVCAITAFFIGAFIIVTKTEMFVRNNKTYYVVGKSFESVQSARGYALNTKNVGGAGYVYQNGTEHFVVYAVYESESDANTVAQNVNAEVMAIDIKQFLREKQIYELLTNTLDESIELWQEFEKGRTSASLIATILRAKATEIGAYAENENIKTLCSEVSLRLLVTVSSDEYALSADLKNFSAYLTFRLRDFDVAQPVFV